MLVDLWSKGLLFHHYLPDSGSFCDGSSLLLSLFTISEERIKLRDEHVLMVLEIAWLKNEDSIDKEVWFTHIASGIITLLLPKAFPGYNLTL